MQVIHELEANKNSCNRIGCAYTCLVSEWWTLEQETIGSNCTIFVKFILVDLKVISLQASNVSYS